MEMENGEFKDVLYVPNLSFNLLSIYQITHLRDGHRVEFLPDSIQVHSLKDDLVVIVGKVNDEKKLYSFSYFVPKSPSKALLYQSNSNIKLWHERYGHLAFRYLQQLNKYIMVKGLPQINFSMVNVQQIQWISIQKGSYKGSLQEHQLFYRWFTWY